MSDVTKVHSTKFDADDGRWTCLLCGERFVTMRAAHAHELSDISSWLPSW
jgi:hypothetical protein